MSSTDETTMGGYALIFVGGNQQSSAQISTDACVVCFNQLVLGTKEGKREKIQNKQTLKSFS